MMFPGMTKAEAKQSKMKVARLAKRSIGNTATRTQLTARTASTASLTTFSCPTLGTGETRNASQPMAAVINNSDKGDLILRMQLLPMSAPPTLPILQLSIPTSIESVSTLGGAPSVASSLSTSSSSTFTFSDQNGELESTTSLTSSLTSPTSTCQSYFGNGHRYSHASSYGINIGAPSARRTRTDANALKKEGFILVRKNVKQKQAERHNRSLESARNSA
jgi:hypothetical protein